MIIAVAAVVMAKTAMLASTASLPTTSSSLLVAHEPYPQGLIEILFNDEHHGVTNTVTINMMTDIMMMIMVVTDRHTNSGYYDLSTGKAQYPY